MSAESPELYPELNPDIFVYGPLIKTAMSPERSDAILYLHLENAVSTIVQPDSRAHARTIFNTWRENYASSSLPKGELGALLDRDDQGERSIDDRDDIQLRRNFMVDIIVFLGLSEHSNLSKEERADLIKQAAAANAHLGVKQAAAANAHLGGDKPNYYSARMSLLEAIRKAYLQTIFDATVARDQTEAARRAAYESGRKANHCLSLLRAGGVITPIERFRTTLTGFFF